MEEETTLGEETALERAVAALTIYNKKKWHCRRAGVEDIPGTAKGAAREAARARRLSSTSTRSSQAQDLLLGGKRVGRGVAVPATAHGTPGRLALLGDNAEGRSYLVDTGSAYSILPFSSTAQTTGPALTPASGASIKAWGHRVQISAGGRHFICRYLQAEVAFPIIGADLLVNFKMAVDLSSMQLKIPLEAPRAGSLTAAAIGVVDYPSAPSLLTVEALSSSPTHPTEEALGDSSPGGGGSGSATSGGQGQPSDQGG